MHGSSYGGARLLKVGIIGVGGIAQRHIRSLVDRGGVELTFCDVVQERAREAARVHGGRSFSDPEEMLSAVHPDVVFLCTPPSVRADVIDVAAHAGAAIFCEKPPALREADGKAAVDSIRATGVTSNVGFMYRWLGAVDQARQALAGRPLLAIRSAFLCGPVADMNLPAWFYLQERSGGPLLDQAIHVLDLHRYFGGEIVAVSAMASRSRPRSDSFTIDDTHTLNLRFASGLIGSHTHSWAYRSSYSSFELIAADARLDIDLLNNRCAGVVDGKPVAWAPEDDCYRTEVEAFLRAVEHHDPSGIRSPYEDGLRSASVAWAAIEAARAGDVRGPVTL